MTVLTVDKICTETIKLEDKTLVKINLTEATFQHADEFRHCLDELVKLGNHKLILDFSLCKFIDSTFLGSIAIILKELKKVEGNLKIVYSGNFALAIMTSNGINRAVEMYESVEEALISY